jgi:hypothetical protein
VVTGGSGNGGTYTHVWDILFGGSQSREIVSPDSFVIVTALNDYYTISYSGQYSSYTVTKTVNLLNSATFNTRLTVTFGFSGYPTPHNINVNIYVQSGTSVSQLNLIS